RRCEWCSPLRARHQIEICLRRRSTLRVSNRNSWLAIEVELRRSGDAARRGRSRARCRKCWRMQGRQNQRLRKTEVHSCKKPKVASWRRCLLQTRVGCTALGRQAGRKKVKRPASEGGRYKIKKYGAS